jgi:hypothetical protein
MKTRRLWVILGGLGVLSAAFLLMNCHAAASNTDVLKNSVTTSIRGEQPTAMQRKDKISIVLLGEGPLVCALQISQGGYHEYE